MALHSPRGILDISTPVSRLPVGDVSMHLPEGQPAPLRDVRSLQFSKLKYSRRLHRRNRRALKRSPCPNLRLLELFGVPTTAERGSPEIWLAEVTSGFHAY